ncbi:pilin [Patescibacteria group bacterium]|nr:pilin [Patescibacteria group bacterium]
MTPEQFEYYNQLIQDTEQAQDIQGTLQPPPVFDTIGPVGNFINKIIAVAENILDIILPIVGALIVILIIWVGIKYITGGVKAEESAKKALVAIFIGVAIILLAYVIVNTVAHWFPLADINYLGPDPILDPFVLY